MRTVSAMAIIGDLTVVGVGVDFAIHHHRAKHNNTRGFSQPFCVGVVCMPACFTEHSAFLLPSEGCMLRRPGIHDSVSVCLRVRAYPKKKFFLYFWQHHSIRCVVCK